MSFLTPVWSYVDVLVHPAAHTDALTAARHRVFIASRIIGSLAVLGGFPIYLVFRGVPSALEIGAFGWLTTFILVAYYLSKTGQYETAHILSSLSLSGLITAIALQTGGIGSFATLWLVVIPLEAALSASRRVIMLASALALAATGILFISSLSSLDAAAILTNEHSFLALGIAFVTFCATAVSLGTQWLTQTGLTLLHAEERRNRILSRATGDLIVSLDRDGAIVSIMGGNESAFGLRGNDLVGHNLFERLHLADRPVFLTALADVAKYKEARSLECRLRRGGESNSQNPPINWVELKIQCLDPILESGTNEFVMAIREIGERKAQERAIEIAQSESERANTTKSRFVANMSHELRTPLNAIIGFSEMLSDESIVFDPDRKLEYAKLINSSGRHLLSVVNGILEMSKLETGNFDIVPERLSPKEAITNCCDLFVLKARESGVSINLRIAPDLPDILADRCAFSQIMINLISNAIKFTERAGSVTVSAHREGTYLAVHVEDSGIGIDRDDLPRIGEAFFQARASGERRTDGTGLGLSIVKGLVHLHDGTIDISSRVGKGTRVVVRLPIDGETSESPADAIEFVRGGMRELDTVGRVKESA